ncbi:MAG: SPASM domain-containing protein [Candidatus Micrarchaeaceae archaeon]
MNPLLISGFGTNISIDKRRLIIQNKLDKAAMVSAVAKIERSKYAVKTKENIKASIKSFYKHFLGNDEYYPENKYIAFVNELFDLWYDNDDPAIHIPIFEEIIRAILNRGSRICQIGHEVCANTTFTFYPDGTLRPCDKFPRSYGAIKGDSIVSIGSINTIDNVFSTDSYEILLNSQRNSLKICNYCPWYNACKSACAFDRQMLMQIKYTKEMANFLDCPTYKIYEHIYNFISDELNGYRDGGLIA